MEEIIKQSFTFAEISVYKNYCNIDNKPKPISIDDISLNDDFSISHADMTSRSLKSVSNDFDLLLYQKGQYQFFYSNNRNNYFVNYAKRDKPQVFYETIKLSKAVSLGKSENKHLAFETTKSKHIKKYYYNPFANITIHKIERWIKKDGDKIIVKLFANKRSRGVNGKYFIKHTESITITFNLKTGNFNIVEFEAEKKKQTKHFYSNSFTCLKQSLETIYGFHSKFSSFLMISEISKIFNNYQFQKIMKKIFEFDENFIEQGTDFYIKAKDPAYGRETTRFTTNVATCILIDFIGLWLNKFIELKKIKIPNDAMKLVAYYYPTEKFLKKNDRKLIASILDRFNIKSKITIKILHQQSNVSLPILIKTCYLFGKNYSKYIGNIPLEFFFNSGNSFLFGNSLNNEDVFGKNSMLEFIKETDVSFNDIEKENIIKIINNYWVDRTIEKQSNSHSVIDMIYDHYRMLKNVKEYYPELQLQSRTFKSFRNDHVQLSVIENRIKRGMSIEYIFDDKMIEEIEKPIEMINTDWVYDKSTVAWEMTPIVKRDVFIPKILKTTEDYIEEGEYMHHCVSGYVDKEQSVIVSLRHHEERVTCEYSTRTRTPLQMRYFTNDSPPEHYIKPLEILEKRIRDFSGRFMSINKIKKNLQINGKEVPIPTEDFF